MTNEKKATIGTIMIIGLIILGFIIEPLGKGLLITTLAIIVSGLALVIAVLLYFIIRENLIELFEWIDNTKERKSKEMLRKIEEKHKHRLDQLIEEEEEDI